MRLIPTGTRPCGRAHSQRWIDVSTDAMNRAMDVHRALAGRRQHRNFRLPDLIIAAAAELDGPRSCTMTPTMTASPRSPVSRSNG